MITRNPALYLLSTLLLFLFCGGSSEQGNSFHVCGRITSAGGSRTCQVALVPEDFNPITDKDDNVIYTESDTCGTYTFEEVAPGNYYLNAFEPEHNERLLRGPLSIEENNLPLGTDTVSSTSYIIADIDVSSSDTVVGLYIKGTTQFVSNINNHHSLAIPSVPSGMVDIISVVKTSASQTPVTRPYVEKVTVAATDTVGISYNNRPPYFIGDATQFTRSIELNSLYNDTINAIDPEGDSLTFSLIDGPENMSLDDKSGIVSWSGPPDDSPVTSNTYTYTVKIADSKGAFTTATWELIPEKPFTSTPTPVFSFGDSQVYYSQSIGTYFVEPFTCSISPTRYRFLFDETDTSGWDTVPGIEYKWDPAETKHALRAQMSCEDYDLPSEWSELFYTFIIADSITYKPSTPLLAGPDTCITGKTFYYQPFSKECDYESTFFMIDWGDGDTLTYTPDYSVDTIFLAWHLWQYSGEYDVRIAVSCSGFDSLSDFSDPFHVFVYSDSPSIKQLPPPPGPDTVLMFDTIFIDADTNVCDGAEYQFFCGDTPLGDKSNYPYDIYIPDALDTYRISYKVWCEASEEPIYASLPLWVHAAAWPETCTPTVSVKQTPVDSGFGVAAAVLREQCNPQYTDCLYQYILEYVAGGRTYSDTSSWAFSDTIFTVPQEPGISVKVSAKTRCREDSLQYESDWGYEVIELQ
jgi:hypothetical protein